MEASIMFVYSTRRVLTVQCVSYDQEKERREEKAVWVFEEANLVSMGLISVIDDYKAVAIYHITGQHCTTSTIFQVVAADVH